MRPSQSLLRPPSSGTLWSAALALWLSLSPAQAEESHWAFDVAHAHIAREYAWPRAEYHLRIRNEDADRVLVYVHHKDDEHLGRRNSQGSWIAGGGKSFEMFLSTRTHGIITKRYFQ